MATKPIDYDALERQALSSQNRMQNMLGGVDLPAASDAPHNMMDYFSTAASSVGNALAGGLASVQSAADRAIRSSPTLGKVKRFFGDFGNALSNGVSQAPTVSDAFDKARQMPDILRQAQQSAQR